MVKITNATICKRAPAVPSFDVGKDTAENQAKTCLQISYHHHHLARRKTKRINGAIT